MSELYGVLITPNRSIIPLKIIDADINQILYSEKTIISYTNCPHIKSEGITIYFRNIANQNLPNYKNVISSQIAKRDIYGIAIIIFPTNQKDIIFSSNIDSYLEKLISMSK